MSDSTPESETSEPETSPTTDSWGEPIRYEWIDTVPWLRSAGNDRTFDTPDDLFLPLELPRLLSC